jgi:hypothetical protein
MEIHYISSPYHGSTPYSFVWSRNAKRRDLKSGEQRAAIFVKIKPHIVKEITESSSAAGLERLGKRSRGGRMRPALSLDHRAPAEATKAAHEPSNENGDDDD